MIRGQKPIPTALKVLAGNPGKRPLNRREPQPKPKLPRPPETLSDPARALWKKLGRKFLDIGLMTELDAPMFAMFCEAYTQWEQLIIKARKHGPVVKQHGQLVPNPYLSRADKEAEKCRRLLEQFGGSPAARSRIQVEPGAKTTPQHELESFLNSTVMKIAS